MSVSSIFFGISAYGMRMVRFRTTLRLALERPIRCRHVPAPVPIIDGCDLLGVGSGHRKPPVHKKITAVSNKFFKFVSVWRPANPSQLRREGWTRKRWDYVAVFSELLRLMKSFPPERPKAERNIVHWIPLWPAHAKICVANFSLEERLSQVV